LVELLLVIAIVALLLAILVPTLGRVRGLTRNAVCQSNLHQWAVAIVGYTADWRGSYGLEKYHAGSWMEDYKPYYGNLAELRCCPMATETGVGFGATWRAWGPNMQAHGFRPTDYGSYGMNHWLLQLTPGTDGWRGHPDWQWGRVANAVSASEIPVMADCAWYGGNPFDYDSKATMSMAPATETWNEDNPFRWQYDMARFGLNRHNGAINAAFADGTARRVALNELWGLLWHKGFRQRQYVHIPWLD